tara:strand:+ start:2458 stop:2595 length:138 start_codon:yes stop_codon:yes gene_type:complete
MKTKKYKDWNYLTEEEERNHFKNKQLLKDLRDISKDNLNKKDKLD